MSLSDQAKSRRPLLEETERHKKFHKDGKEYPDPVPVSRTAQIQREFDEIEATRETIRNLIGDHREQSQYESWEEANDFDIDDDEDLFPVGEFDVPWEDEFEPERPLPKTEAKPDALLPPGEGSDLAGSETAEVSDDA